MRDGDATGNEDTWNDAAWSEARAELAAAAPPEPAGEAAAGGVAARLTPLLTRIMLGEERDTADELPIRVVAWDGSAVGPAGAPAFVIRHRRALRRLLWKPGELGFVRAYVAGELDIEGDVFAALGAVLAVLGGGDGPIRLTGDEKRDIVRTAVTLGAVGPEPKPPPEESWPGRAARRDDGPGGYTGPMREPAAFFGLLFGAGLAHGTGLWDGAADLAAAQSAAHEDLAERLGLAPGARLLDLNCGWGAFARHAADRYGARVVALARDPAHADHVRAATAGPGTASTGAAGTGAAGTDPANPGPAGPGAGVEVRGWDLAEAGEGPYDAIVGLADIAAPDRPAARLAELLAPGGRLVLRQPVRRSGAQRNARTFTGGYLLPEEDEPRPLGAIVGELEDAGLEVRTVTALREDHARTLRAWADGLRRHWSRCAELAGPGRARVWLLHLATSALACEDGRMGGYEIRVRRQGPDGGGDRNRTCGPAVIGR